MGVVDAQHRQTESTSRARPADEQRRHIRTTHLHRGHQGGRPDVPWQGREDARCGCRIRTEHGRVLFGAFQRTMGQPLKKARRPDGRHRPKIKRTIRTQEKHNRYNNTPTVFIILYFTLPYGRLVHGAIRLRQRRSQRRWSKTTFSAHYHHHVRSSNAWRALINLINKTRMIITLIAGG